MSGLLAFDSHAGAVAGCLDAVFPARACSSPVVLFGCVSVCMVLAGHKVPSLLPSCRCASGPYLYRPLLHPLPPTYPWIHLNPAPPPGVLSVVFFSPIEPHYCVLTSLLVPLVLKVQLVVPVKALPYPLLQSIPIPPASPASAFVSPSTYRYLHARARALSHTQSITVVPLLIPHWTLRATRHHAKWWRCSS